MIESVGIILGVIGLSFHLLYLLIYVEDHNLVNEKRIRLPRGNSIDVMVSENEEYYGILKMADESEELVIHMEEYLLNWYVVTEKGYYIFSRLGKKVKEYKELEEMTLKEKEKFLIHFQDSDYCF